MLASKHSGISWVQKDEQGQVLILFVALFTIVLALAAFAIDQGLWYGKKRIAQKDVDLAARSGALAYMGDGDRCNKAESTAELNGATLETLDGSLPCEDDDPSAGANGPICVTARVEREVGALFARLFNIDGIDVGGESVACAGTSLGIRAYEGGDGLNGIPVVLAPTGNPRGCMDNDTLLVGTECVIWGARNDDTGALSTSGAAAKTESNRLLWTAPDGGCFAPNDIGDLDQIQEGVEWTCHDKNNYVEVTRQQLQTPAERDNILARFRSRLSGPSCAFLDTFVWGDGTDANVAPPPPFLNGNPARDEIYVQDYCPGNSRLVILPVGCEFDGDTTRCDLAPCRDVNDVPLRCANSDGPKRVTGIAVVYLTGCYDNDAPIVEPNPTAETNECTAPFTDKTEVRGVPLRVFLTQGAVGDLGAMDYPNYPLTIQTCQSYPCSQPAP